MFTAKSIIFSSIFALMVLYDYTFGNGVIEILHKWICKTTCYMRKYIREETDRVRVTASSNNPISVPVLLAEVFLLTFTFVFFNRYKKIHQRDSITELIQESREDIRQTNEFLEKWRLRRVANEYSYLDEEPQDIKPLKLEVPILHMAIVDTLGKTRSQPESGDAGDTINITDSTLLSVTSFIDDDLESTPDNRESSSDERIDERVEYRKRYLWDVMEEDTNYFENH